MTHKRRTRPLFRPERPLGMIGRLLLEVGRQSLLFLRYVASGSRVHNQVSPVRLALFRPMTLLGYFPVYKDSWHTKQLTSRTFRREQLGSSCETVSNYSYPLDDWPDDSNHPSTSPSVGIKPDRPNLTEYHAVVRTVRIPCGYATSLKQHGLARKLESQR